MAETTDDKFYQLSQQIEAIKMSLAQLWDVVTNPAAQSPANVEAPTLEY